MSTITLQLKKDACNQLDIENLYFIQRALLWFFFVSVFVMTISFFLTSLGEKFCIICSIICLFVISLSISWIFTIKLVSKLKNPTKFRKVDTNSGFLCISKSFGLWIVFLSPVCYAVFIWFMYELVHHNRKEKSLRTKLHNDTVTLMQSPSYKFAIGCTGISMMALSILMIVTLFKSINLKPFLMESEESQSQQNKHSFNQESQSSIIEPTEEKEDF